VYLLQRGLNSTNFEEKLLRSEMMLCWKYLRIPPNPYLPVNPRTDQITLVLDLEGTLVCTQGGCLARPKLREFLTVLHQKFEMVVFATSPKLEADSVLEKLDIAQFFRYRLYR